MKSSAKTISEEQERIRAQVRDGYAQIAEKVSSGQCGTGVSCCGSSRQDADQLAAALGYAPEELSALPADSNLGLSCGNPHALAALRSGETVLDLGSGGGFDVFVAGRKVGEGGLAIGVDMTHSMLEKARRNAGEYVKRTGWKNVEFRLGEIEHLPVEDESVDVVISNCVINLSPAKSQVWSEIARVLRPGGRVAVSDLALLQPLPEGVRAHVEALVGCVSGAVLVSEMERCAREAGLVDVATVQRSGYVKALTDWEDPLYRKLAASLPAGASMADFLTSLEITATKPKEAPAYTPAVNELVAIGAAIVANCEPCLKYHCQQAQRLGVAQADMARAMEMAGKVKDSPHQAILRLGDKLSGGHLSQPADLRDPCCGSQGSP